MTFPPSPLYIQSNLLIAIPLPVDRELELDMGYGYEYNLQLQNESKHNHPFRKRNYTVVGSLLHMDTAG